MLSNFGSRADEPEKQPVPTAVVVVDVVVVSFASSSAVSPPSTPGIQRLI